MLKGLARRLDAVGPLGLGLLVTAAGFLLDQSTKAAAVLALSDGQVVQAPGPFFFSLTYNSGAAFGIPAPWWLFPIVTIVVVVLVVRNLPRSTTRLEPFAYGLLLAGALGNIADRIAPVEEGARSVGLFDLGEWGAASLDTFGRGEVVDFIATEFNFPTFNVADACITVGFVLLLVAAVIHERQGHRSGPAEQQRPVSESAA